MKHLVTILIIACSTICSYSQTFECQSIEIDPFDLSASTNKRVDNNGEACALVKVAVALPDISFAGSIIGGTPRDGFEYWVYMPAGSKMLQIKHPSYKSERIVFSDFGVASLEGSRTYIMTVTANPAESKTATTAGTDGIYKNILSKSGKVLNNQKLKDPLHAFFPICGIMLGKTTYNDAKKLGYQIKDQSELSIKHNWLNINNIHFKTGSVYEDNDFYDDISIGKQAVPTKWKSDFGMDYSLSYNEWVSLFNSLGFKVDVINAPTIHTYEGRECLKADIKATSPDGSFYFKLTFAFGEEGYTLDTANTLALLDISYLKNQKYEILGKKNTSNVKSSEYSSINDLFPIYGITLGSSTYHDVYKAGFPIEQEGDTWHSNIWNNVSLWNFDNKGVFDELDLVNWKEFGIMPDKWKQMGFSFDNSYNTWRKLLENLGYTVIVSKEPVIYNHSSIGNNLFAAKLHAVADDGGLTIDFNFDYNQGDENTPGTLYQMSVKAM